MFLLAFAEAIQLFPDGTLFIHIALILVMIWALNRTFFKPINAIIDKRLKQQGSRGGEAGEILRSVEEKQKNYDKQMLEDLVTAAFNDARHKADQAAGEEMARIQQGIGLPPGFKLPGM